MNKKDLRPYNNKNQQHGYWEVYRDNGSLYYGGTYENDEMVGKWIISEAKWCQIRHRFIDKTTYFIR